MFPVVTMRARTTAAIAAVLLGFAVLLMHTGAGPAGMSHPATSGHGPQHAAPAVDPADHHPQVEKQTVDVVHDHQAHDCAGTVVVHKSVGAPPLVAIVPVADGAVSPSPSERAALARGPPPWTVPGLSELCVFRV